MTTIKLPELPEWSTYDDLCGMVPSEIRTAIRAIQIAAARVALEAAAQYLEGVHETRLSKFADHIRKIEVSHD